MTERDGKGNGEIETERRRGTERDEGRLGDRDMGRDIDTDIQRWEILIVRERVRLKDGNRNGEMRQMEAEREEECGRQRDMGEKWKQGQRDGE